MIGKSVWIITAGLTAIIGGAGLVWATPAWVLGLLVGAGWGLANAWCLNKAVQCLITGKKGWRLTGWLVAKFIGLYGLVVFFLIYMRLSPLGWLSGFGLSLMGLALGNYRSFAGLGAFRNA